MNEAHKLAFLLKILPFAWASSSVSGIRFSCAYGVKYGPEKPKRLIEWKSNLIFKCKFVLHLEKQNERTQLKRKSDSKK